MNRSFYPYSSTVSNASVRRESESWHQMKAQPHIFFYKLRHVTAPLSVTKRRKSHRSELCLTYVFFLASRAESVIAQHMLGHGGCLRLSLFVALALVSLCNTSRPQNQPPSLLLLLSYSDWLLSHVTPAPTCWLLRRLLKKRRITNTDKQKCSRTHACSSDLCTNTDNRHALDMLRCVCSRQQVVFVRLSSCHNSLSRLIKAWLDIKTSTLPHVTST